MVLDPIPQSLPVQFFGSRPQPPTSPNRTRGTCHVDVTRAGMWYVKKNAWKKNWSGPFLGRLKSTCMQAQVYIHTYIVREALVRNTHQTLVRNIHPIDTRLTGPFLVLSVQLRTDLSAHIHTHRTGGSCS